MSSDPPGAARKHPATVGAGVRALLVDEDGLIRRLVRRVLEHHGYSVAECTDANAALRRHQADPYSLVVTEWTLPDLAGEALIGQLRAVESERPVVVLLTTGERDGETLARALAAGVDDALFKPFGRPELETRLAVLRPRLTHDLARMDPAYLARCAVSSRADLLMALDGEAVVLAHYGLTPLANVLATPSACAVGISLRDLLPPEAWARFDEARKRALEVGEPRRISFETVHGGVARCFVGVISPMRTGKRPREVVVDLRDITGRVRAERAKIRGERLAAVSTLAIGIGHEFNNINAGLMGYISVLRALAGLPEEARQPLDKLAAAAERVTDISHTLLAFADADQGERRDASLGDTVRQAVSINRSTYDRQGLEVELVVREDVRLPLNVCGIASIVEQMLSNALHAMLHRPRKPVTITIGRGEEEAFLRIADQGAGIPQADLARVLTPFFTTKGEHAEADSPLRSVKGTGLGLAVCDMIARAHEGRIQVESEEGTGATFTVLLPIGPRRRADTDYVIYGATHEGD